MLSQHYSPLRPAFELLAQFLGTYSNFHLQILMETEGVFLYASCYMCPETMGCSEIIEHTDSIAQRRRRDEQGGYLRVPASALESPSLGLSK